MIARRTIRGGWTVKDIRQDRIAVYKLEGLAWLAVPPREPEPWRLEVGVLADVDPFDRGSLYVFATFAEASETAAEVLERATDYHRTQRLMPSRLRPRLLGISTPYPPTPLIKHRRKKALR